MANEKVFSDTGPIIHLWEIDALRSLGIFEEILIPSIVIDELSKKENRNINIEKNVRCTAVKQSPEDIKFATKIMNEQSLTRNDALILSIAVSRGATILLSDDLEVRNSSKNFNIRPVGTIGILLRAYREGINSLEKTILLLQKISESSLFITPDLIDQAISSAIHYKKN